MAWANWLKKAEPAEPIHDPRDVPAPPAAPKATAVPAVYAALHTYLRDRYADTVVLTFAQIESLIGSALPDLARRQPAWWADPDEGGVPSTQSAAWTRANRTVIANLGAETAAFARSAGRT